MIPLMDAWTTRASPDGPGDRTLHWKSNSTPRMTCAGAGYAGWGHHRRNSACIAGSKATTGLNPQGSFGRHPRIRTLLPVAIPCVRSLLTAARPSRPPSRQLIAALQTSAATSLMPATGPYNLYVPVPERLFVPAQGRVEVLRLQRPRNVANVRGSVSRGHSAQGLKAPSHLHTSSALI